MGNSSLTCPEMLDALDGVIERGNMQAIAANRVLASLQTIGKAPGAQGASVIHLRRTAAEVRRQVRLHDGGENRSSILCPYHG